MPAIRTRPELRAQLIELHLTCTHCEIFQDLTKRINSLTRRVTVKRRLTLIFFKSMIQRVKTLLMNFIVIIIIISLQLLLPLQ